MKQAHIRAHFKPQSMNEENKTVDLCFATEAKVLRYDEKGKPFFEVLAMHPRYADLNRLNHGAALLDNHKRGSIDDQIGVIEKAWIDPEKKEALVTARFSSHPDRQRLWDDVKNGIIQNVSFGYTVERFISLSEYEALCRAHDSEEKKNSESNPAEKDAPKSQPKSEPKFEKEKKEDQDEDPSRSIPTQIGIGWQALEVSLVTIPADMDAGTRSENLSPKLTRTPSKPQRNAMENQIDPQTLESAVEKARTEQTERLLQIKEIIRTADLPEEVELRYFKSKDSLDEIRKDAFQELAKRSTQTETRSHISAGGLDEVETRREGMENAILHRANPEKFKIDERGKRFAQMRLLSLAKLSLESSGVRSVDHFSEDEVLTRSLQGTSEFPLLLTNVVNKSLRSDYEGAPSIWKEFTRIVPAKDFRPIQRMQLGDTPVPTRVNEKGEAKRITLSESATSYRVETYEQIINFTRQLMINDDIGFIATIPGKLGLGCAELEANIVLGLITGNPLMTDQKPLFHEDHNNILKGGHLIDIESTSMVRSMMRRHVGLDGRKLNIIPKNYLVPTALETLAEQFVSTNLVASETNHVNPFAGKLGVLCDVRFDDASPFNWYMIASPTSVDIVEAAYLNGEPGPKIETRHGFEISGMEIKVTHDFGAGILDYRGIFQVEGRKPEFGRLLPDPTSTKVRAKSKSTHGSNLSDEET